MLNNFHCVIYSTIMLSPSLILSGCISSKSAEPPIPISYYQAPSAEMSKNTATIIGDRYKRESILADTVAYVFAVDGQKFVDAEQNLEQLLRIEAGQRDLQLWCQRGGFKYTNVLTVNLEANKHYQVGYQLNGDSKRGDHCLLWVYDLDAKQGIGELTEGVSLWKYADPQKMRPMAGYMEPTRQATNITVPIVINNK